MERQHDWVKEAARVCIGNKDKKTCEVAIKGARDKIKETITDPLEETGLGGVEEYLSPEVKPPEANKETEGEKSPDEMTDEELYESCEPCHIGTAVVQFSEINKEHPSELATKLIDEKIGGYVEPEDWIKNMIQVCEGTEGDAKAKFCSSLADLHGYLERRDSPILKKLDEQPSE